MDSQHDGSNSYADWRKKAAAVVERARTQIATQAFAVTGHLPDMPFSVFTSLQIDGVLGRLQLPVAQQMSSLLAVGTPAPYGRGAETVLDTTVRKATQLDAASVHANEVGQQQMQRLTAHVVEGLGVDTRVQVEARLYKLLVYTDGGHFQAHRDTEKEPGMFGTLVVQLPVVGGHVGGEFTFRHNGKEINWSTEVDSSSTFQYAAFYADVAHELRPITSGTRVVLVYNLVRTGTDHTPSAADGCKLVQELREAVSSWAETFKARPASVPRSLCVPLEHQYTKSSLSYDAMKGADARVVACLSHPHVGLDVYLALMHETEVYGDVEYERDRLEVPRGAAYSSASEPECSGTEDDTASEYGCFGTEDNTKHVEAGFQYRVEEMSKLCDEHIVTMFSLSTCVALDGSKLPSQQAAQLGLLKGRAFDAIDRYGNDYVLKSQLNPKAEWLAGGTVWNTASIREAGGSHTGNGSEGSEGRQPNRRCMSAGLKPVAADFHPYGKEGAKHDKIYHVTLAVIQPKFAS